MRKKSGFSLMEMMIVLLITAVVAAATAPIVSKKMVLSTGGDSPWLWAGTNHSIVYNVDGNPNKTANIGDIYTGDDKTRMYIATAGKTPQISFKGTGDTIMKLLASNDSIIFSNAIDNLHQFAVALGANTKPDGNYSVSIGSGDTVATSASTRAIAIGPSTVASATKSIAIGAGTSSLGSRATAIGSDSKASGDNATAVGATSVSAANGLALGYKAAAGANSLALGALSNASGTNALAIGYGAQAMKTGCVGIVTGGTEYGAKGDYSTAYGYKAKASGENSIAIGNTNATAYKSITIGDNNTNEGTQSIVIGDQSATVNSNSGGAVIIGGFAKAQDYGVSIGWNAGKDKNGTGAVSIGTSARAGKHSTAIGYSAGALYDYSTAIGYNANTTASNQIVLGNANTTVYIPGRLIVDNGTILGRRSELTYLRIASHGGDSKNTCASLEWASTGNLGWFWKGVSMQGGHENSDPYPMSSDRRLKNVGEAFKGGLAELKKLDVFNFTFKKDTSKTPMVGVMAQDLQKVFPNAVFKGDDGFLRIRWDEMFFSMINAIKELDLKISNHDKKFEELQKQNTELQKRVDKLEQRLDKLEKAGKKVK